MIFTIQQSSSQILHLPFTVAKHVQASLVKISQTFYQFTVNPRKQTNKDIWIYNRAQIQKKLHIFSTAVMLIKWFRNSDTDNNAWHLLTTMSVMQDWNNKQVTQARLDLTIHILPNYFNSTICCLINFLHLSILDCSFEILFSI